MNIHTAQKERSKFAIFIVIARYLLVSVFALPFLVIGLAFDLIKLPLLVFLIVPIWLMLDLTQWLKTGNFELTIDGSLWCIGLALMIETFYGS